MTAAKTHQNSLDKTQNQALRIVTGVMKSTPIEDGEADRYTSPYQQKKAEDFATGHQVYNAPETIK